MKSYAFTQVHWRREGQLGQGVSFHLLIRSRCTTRPSLSVARFTCLSGRWQRTACATVTDCARAYTSIPIRHVIPRRSDGKAGETQPQPARHGVTSSSSFSSVVLSEQETHSRQGIDAEDWTFSLYEAPPDGEQQQQQDFVRDTRDGQERSQGTPSPDGHGGGAGCSLFSAYDFEAADNPSTSLPHEVRVPRILFFGGDVVSLTALEALYERLECIARRAFALEEDASLELGDASFLSSEHPGEEAGGAEGGPGIVTEEHHHRSHRRPYLPHLLHLKHRHRLLRMKHKRQRLLQSVYAQPGPLPGNSREARRVQAFLQDHLTIVCPYLPNNITPEEAARRYSRQYPVARFAVEKGLPVIPVDHAKSLAKSQLLRDMLGDRGTAGSGLQHARQERERQRQEERERRRRTETRVGRWQSFLEKFFGMATAAAAPMLAGPTYYFSSVMFSSVGATAPTQDAGKASDPAASPTASRPTVPLADAISTPWSRHGRPLKDFDLAVVVSFRYFIPARLLEALPPTVNMHPSLLPLYRGASPIFSTLMRNEPVGGASIIQLRAEQKMMDSGNIVWQCEVPIPPDMDIRTYMPLVTQLGAAGLCDTIFGEQLRRNPIWCHRHGHLLCSPSTPTPLANSTPPLDGCASTAREDTNEESEGSNVPVAPPLITPSVISAALRAHHTYVQYCEHCALTGTIPSSPSSTHREIRCADAFPCSVHNAYCDWPDSFWYNWRTAPAQQYEPFAHFSHDPFHAPLLPRDAAVLRFSELTGLEAYGRWRAFVGGQHFQPAVNATLDKSCTPVRNQLSKRTLRRLVREKLKRLGKSSPGGETKGKRAADPPHQQPGSTEKKKDVVLEAARRVAQERKAQTDGTLPKPPHPGKRKRKTQKAAPIDLDAVASIIDTDMLREVEEDLRLSCTFTKLLHPDLVPPSVLEEMAAVEEGPPACCCHAPQGGAATPAACLPPEGVRFFRQPPPIFSCAKMTEKVKEAEAARRERRRIECAARRKERGAAQAHVVVLAEASTIVVEPSVSPCPVEKTTTGREDLKSVAARAAMLTATMRQGFAAVLPAALAPRVMSPASTKIAAPPTTITTAAHIRGAEVSKATLSSPSKTARNAMEEEEEDEDEDEETARKESGLVLLKTPELRMALTGEEEEDGGAGGGDAGLDEEAPLGYVPDVIPIAPPVLPWMADLGEEVGKDFLASEKVEETERAALVAAARRAEKEAEAIRRNKALTAAAHQTRSRCRSSAAKSSIPSRFYIPTGTAYFPVSDEHIGAIKCKDGWLFWQEAHLKYATRAQPVVLLRKGMAMKTGILYAGLFSEYCK